MLFPEIIFYTVCSISVYYFIKIVHVSPIGTFLLFWRVPLSYGISLCQKNQDKRNVSDRKATPILYRYIIRIVLLNRSFIRYYIFLKRITFQLSAGIFIVALSPSTLPPGPAHGTTLSGCISVLIAFTSS